MDKKFLHTLEMCNNHLKMRSGEKMGNFSQSKLLRELEIILREAKRSPREFKVADRPARLFVSGGKSLILDDKGLDAFNNAVNEILKDDFFSANFTRKYVEDKIVMDFIINNYSSYLDGTLDIDARLSDEIQELRGFNERYQVIIPIGGIDFQRRGNLKVGNIEIGLFRKKDFSFRKLLTLSPVRTYLNGLEGQLVGTIDVAGEPLKAKEKALYEVARALKLLRLYVRAFHVKSTEVQIRILSQLMLGPGGPSLVDYPNKRILYSGELPAGIVPLTINKKNLEKMRRFGFNEISSLLRKELHDISPFEREILLAINWYGTAVDMTDPVLKFLNYAIVLEVLLSKQEKDSDRTITDKLAESVAFLLGKKYENRVKIKRNIKRLYGVRSSIVHGGKDFVEDRELRLIEYVALRLIILLLRKKSQFQAKQELLDWVEKKRLR